jgi:hypothetical protein
MTQSKNMMQSKKPYVAPRLTVYGNVGEITGQTSSNRTFTDYAFQADTHRDEILYSGPVYGS